MRRSISIPIAVTIAAAAAAWMGCARGSASSEVTPEAAEGACEERGISFEWGANSVSVVCAEELDGIPAMQIEELLEGRVPGVWVIRGARGISLMIRGQSTILGNTEPLYVLDGVPLQMEPGRGLYWLSPRDIQKVEILKDAGAAAFYGVRGANGVVLITTRRR